MPQFLLTFARPLLVILASCPFVLGQEPVHPANSMWVVDPSQLNRAEQTLAATLQGLVAKTTPAIWFREPGMNTVLLDELREEGVTLRDATSVWDLVEHFRQEIRGFIVYELDTDSINVATSLCGPHHAVAVDTSLVPRAEQAGLRQILDVRGRSELETFRQFSNRFSSRVVVVQDERKHSHLRDWAVHQDAFCFFGVDPAAGPRLLREIGSLPTVYGWEGERRFVQGVSQSGGVVVPADWSRNLSTLSRLPVEIPRPPRRYPEPVETGERIVAFVMSDGDNIQWMGGGFVNHAGFWGSPHRGQWNMTWEVAPVLAEIAPRALRHLYRTATSGHGIDGFVTGPSGAGYVFPHYHSNRGEFARLTGRLMKHSHLAVVSVLNADGTMEESCELLAQPEVLGALYKGWIYDSEQGRILWQEGKPCVSYRYLLWEPKPEKSPQGVAEAIGQLPADPLNDQRSYALINVHAWSFRSIGGPMEAVNRCIQRLPPKTRVVTAEQLIILLRNNFGTPVDRESYQRDLGR